MRRSILFILSLSLFTALSCGKKKSRKAAVVAKRPDTAVTTGPKKEIKAIEASEPVILWSKKTPLVCEVTLEMSDVEISEPTQKIESRAHIVCEQDRKFTDEVADIRIYSGKFIKWLKENKNKHRSLKVGIFSFLNGKNEMLGKWEFNKKLKLQKSSSSTVLLIDVNPSDFEEEDYIRFY